MVSVSSDNMIPIGHRMPIRSCCPSLLGIQSHFSSIFHAVQKHFLQRVCALDIEFEHSVSNVSEHGHQADGATRDQIDCQVPSQFLPVGPGTFGDAVGWAVDEQKAETCTNKVASTEKQSV